jgi:amino acid adenylation domain-containing protein
MSFEPLFFTPYQQAVLNDLRKDPDAPGQTQPMAVTVAGVTDETLLKKAVCRFIDTADIFRLRVDLLAPDGGARLAEVSDRFTDIEFLDLTDFPPDEQEPELIWMILDEAEHGWDLRDAWPVRVNAVRLKTDQWAVVFLFHRLIYHRGARNRYITAFAAAFQVTGNPGGEAAVLSLPSWFEYVRHDCPSLQAIPDHDRAWDDVFSAPLLAEAGRAGQNLGPLQSALMSLAKDHHLEMPHLLLTGVLLWHHLFGRITASEVEVDFPDAPADAGMKPLGPVSCRGRISTTVTEQASLADLARQVKQMWLKALRQAAVLGEVDSCDNRFAPDTGARIRVFYDCFDTGVHRDGPVQVTGSHADILNTDVDLELIFTSPAGGMSLTVVYDQQLMEFDAAKNLGRELLAVFSVLTSEFDGSVTDLQQKLAASRRIEPVSLPLSDPNPEIETPEALFTETAARYPDHVAVVTAADCITYQDLNDLSGRLAWAVHDKAGRGGRVGILLDQGIPAVIAILAVLRSGNAYVPLDCTMPARRLRFMVTDADLSLVILNRDTDPLWQTLACPVPPVLLMDDMPETLTADFREPAAGPEEDAYIIYTSGTTGRPKGVVQTRKNVCHFVRIYTGYLEITPDDSLTLMSAFLFDAAVLDIFSALSTGARLVMFDLKKEDLTTVSRLLIQEQVTIYHSTASVYRYLMDSVESSMRFPKVRYAVLGGEPGFRSDLVKFQTHFNVSAMLVNLYGLSELTIGTMGFFSHETELNTKWLPIGGPIAGVSVSVLDDRGCSTPGAGQMVFTGVCLARGYRGLDGLTAEKFLVRPDGTQSFLTGDIGEITEAGELIHLGRKDFQIKVRGYRVEPGDIEACITALDQVDNCVVLPVPDTDGEPVLTAFIILAPGMAGMSAPAMARFLEPSLPGYMIPQKVIITSSFPRTSSGKIDRKTLEMQMTEVGE